MRKIYDSIEDLVGHTPLLRLNKLGKKLDLPAAVLAKCEFYNPIFSVKDRVALNMLNRAPFSKIDEQTVFIEATSGNTGVGLAAFCAARGHKLVIVMPENMSPEKIALIRQFGAEVLLTPAEEGMAGAIKKVQILKARSANIIELKQFENPANVEVHQLTTATEIIEDTGGNVDAVVCGVGTGGTITGIGEVLREHYPDIEIWAAEPEDAAILAGGSIGTHVQMGIGDGLIPDILNTEIYDNTCIIPDDNALDMAKRLASEEGIMCGISSGTNVVAAIVLAEKLGPGKTVVTVLPDTAERYFSTPLFE